MQLNKVIKGMMWIVPVLAIGACSSHKSVCNSDQSDTDTSYETGIKTNKSSDEKPLLQMQEELKRNNVIYFDLDKYNIRSEFDKILNAHANFLRNNPSHKVTVEGHTDERGTPEYNIALGERRANTLKIYLQSKGVSVDQIDIVSYGEEQPAILGHDETAYAKNRRAVLVY